MDGSHWIAPDGIFGEATAVGMSVANSDHDYSYRNDFEIWRENQEFERQNISMSQPPLDTTPIGTNTTNIIMSHLELTPIGTKMPDHKPLTRPIDLSRRKGKTHVPEDQALDTSSSDSSSSESDSSDDSKYRKSNS